ncbi:MAG: HAD family hydrolase [Thermoanaerobaculia bacterium]
MRPLAAESFEILPGRGAQGRIGGRSFWLGSHRMLEERSLETPSVHERIEKLAAAGRTIVVVGNDDHVCGILAIADEVRPEARAAVQALHEVGVRRVVMLTGDHGRPPRRSRRRSGSTRCGARCSRTTSWLRSRSWSSATETSPWWGTA